MWYSNPVRRFSGWIINQSRAVTLKTAHKSEMPLDMARSALEWQPTALIWGKSSTRPGVCKAPSLRTESGWRLWGLSPGLTDSGHLTWDWHYTCYHDLICGVLTSFVVRNGLSQADKVISYFWWAFLLARHTIPSFLGQPHLWPLFYWEPGSVGGDNGQKEFCKPGFPQPGEVAGSLCSLGGQKHYLFFSLTLSSKLP